MTVAVKVMVAAHPHRTEAARILAARARAAIVWDPEPDGEPSAWRTVSLAWQLGLQCRASHHTHVAVLQDDVLVCRDFPLALQRAISARPTRSVSLYANRRAVADARERGWSWVRIPDGLWGQGVVMPASRAAEFVRFCRTSAYSERFGCRVDEMPGGWDDRRLVAFHDAIGECPYVTVPSLVEHGSPSDSLLSHNNRTRVATWFIGEDGLGAAIDWKRGPE